MYCKDKSKGFEPSNCLWDKPHLHGDDEKYLAFGEYKTLTEWADDDRSQVAQSSLSERLKKGMSLEEALTTPPTRNNGASRNPAKIGDVYGRLTIIDGPWMEKKGQQMASKVRCRCECGKEIEVFVNSMKGEGRGKTRSCGCLKSDVVSKMVTIRNTTHGM